MNRAFLYGDLLFETIKVTDGTPQLLSLHYDRLIQSARVLKFETSLSFESFSNSVKEVIQTKQIQSARVRFTLHRNAPGFYTPEHNGTAYFVDVFPLPPINQTALNLGVYTDNYKPCNELASLKSGNALVSVMAGIFAKENKFDDAILLNEHGCVCEATSSNIFLVKDDKVYTPALTEGCVAGVMRTHVLAQLKHADYEVFETVISVEQLMQADAVFLTSAIKGIVGVGSIDNYKIAIQFALSI